MASFSRILKLASLFLLPLAAAAPTQNITEVGEPKAQLADDLTVAEAMRKHVPRNMGCANEHGGVHLIVARGTSEPPGEGALSNVANLITQGIPGSDISALDYPASLLPTYQDSVHSGTQAMHHAIRSYVKKCPKSRIVLLGYSQGGQVVMNTLCGTNESGDFTHTPRIEKKYWHHIAAVLVYADPSHLAGKVYDRGTSTLNGEFPRTNSKLCSPFRKRIVSYCDWNDPVCASGDDIQVHFSYFTTYDNIAAPWIINKTQHHMPWTRKGKSHD